MGKGYIVVYDCIDPPVSDYVFIAYFWSDENPRINEQLFNEVKSWAKSLGANKIQTATRNPGDFMRYEFEEISETLMEIKI